MFLDEIGELAVPLQAKLLRVLQERELERVGGTRPIKINIRILAATNRDLEEEVRGKTFRQDLFYRLNVVSVNLPDLRDRREDISLLAMHFIEKHAQARRVIGLSAEATSCLMNYDWPGNVRELENAIERAIVLGSTEQILLDDASRSDCRRRAAFIDRRVRCEVSSDGEGIQEKAHDKCTPTDKRQPYPSGHRAGNTSEQSASLDESPRNEVDVWRHRNWGATVRTALRMKQAFPEAMGKREHQLSHLATAVTSHV